MERLLRKRATVRATITKIVNDMITLMETDPTPTGWTLHGDTRSLPKFNRAETMRNFSICLTEDSDSEQLRSFWEVEHLGLATEKTLSKDDEHVLKNFVDSTIQNNGRYQVELPWRSNCSELKDNRDVALKRLESLQRRL
ncbi:hypothetical protein HPB50_014845 [Hyalomma asiaticum]|uniref:Uncharacterized protein n=1 Tax=Hyalomma asiaticum TaxID=266040 RepID=A0ACB7SW59_HYAAI|nr:hypothetical protein HPB50_014845 [Hyalomma asiaticum]